MAATAMQAASPKTGIARRIMNALQKGDPIIGKDKPKTR